MGPLRFILNGRPVTVDGVDPHTTLLDFLRDRGLTGTKEGCAEGECGACAVVLVSEDRDPQPKTRFCPVNACLMVLPAVAGREVISVEGVRGDQLHPVQSTLAAAGGSQCGYCTPGFVISLFAEYYRPGRERFDPESVAGNLCRCTGYRPIVEAGRKLGLPVVGDRFVQRLEQGVEALAALDYTADSVAGPRRFYRPSSLTELCVALAEQPEARVIAGGTDLVVEVNQRDARWPVMISVEAVPELQVFEVRDGDGQTEGQIEVGAGVNLSELERLLAGRLPIFDELLPLFSSRLIRNRATLGGNLVNASPIGDSPPVLLALVAQLRLVRAGADGALVERRLPLSEFFTGYRTTALMPGELLRSIILPARQPERARFFKVSKRVLDDISTVAAAFALELDAERKISRARLAYGGVAATPVRARAVEDALVGQAWTAATLDGVRGQLLDLFTPMDDHRGSADYRRAMIVRLFEKFMAETSGEAMPTIPAIERRPS